jgi:hypothetical protein
MSLPSRDVQKSLLRVQDLDALPKPRKTTLKSAISQAVPQLHLPIFPEEITLINASLGVMTQDGTVTYIYGPAVLTPEMLQKNYAVSSMRQG